MRRVLVGWLTLLVVGLGAAGAEAEPRTVGKVRLAGCVAGPCTPIRISRASYEHWLAVFRAQTGPASEQVGVRHGLRWQVMQFLIRDAWVSAELARLGLADVAAEAIESEYQRQRAEAYPDDHDLREFLRNTGQTEADLKLRVRLALRVAAIEAHAARPAGADAAAAARLRNAHARAYVKRWRRQTTCARRYRIDDCGDYRRRRS
jgi:hypothetical protein